MLSNFPKALYLLFDKNENLSTLVMGLVSMLSCTYQHWIQNTDGIAALVIPLATYNVDHTHLNYIYGGSSMAHLVNALKEFLKYIPHKEDVTPIYLLIKHSHLSGSKYFSRCLNMTFAVV